MFVKGDEESQQEVEIIFISQVDYMYASDIKCEDEQLPRVVMEEVAINPKVKGFTDIMETELN